MCQGYTPRVPTKYSIFRKNTTQAHQNEKICQQSTFLTFIIYSSLALSLPFVLFLTHSIIFRPFWGEWFPSLCLGRRGILFPQKKPIRQPFPLHTHVRSETFHRENAFFSLSHLCRALFALFSFLAEDIYTLYILLLLSLFGDPRERVGKINSSGRRSVFLDTLSARVSLP